MKKSILHAKTEALYKRLRHPTDLIETELRAMDLGLEGERRLHYFLSEVDGPKRTIHDLRLPNINNSSYFQIDTLLILPSCVYIIEVKHHHGKLHLNRKTKKMTRGDDIFEDPITQVLRQKRGLERYLSAIPIHPLVCFTNKSVVPELSPSDAKEKDFIASVRELPLLIQNHPGTIKIDQVAAFLIQHHQPYDPNIFSYFKIDPSHIHTGIQCEHCHNWTVQRIGRLWICQSCQAKLKDPHLQALRDYVKLFGTKATNHQIRTFTGIESPDVVKKLLKKWAFSYGGKNRGREYVFPESWKWE